MNWRIGILYRVVELLRLLHERPAKKKEILASFALTRFRNVPIEEVLTACIDGGWAQLDQEDTISCTEDGRSLLSIDSAQIRLRHQIEELLNREDPLWASSVVQGRQALASYAPPEAVQCFREAGLLDGEEEIVVAWWDIIACRFRAAQDKVYVEIGRRGEKLTYEWEKVRTGRQPKWVAIEHSNAGYDIVSSISADDNRRLIIEVKTSVLPWNHADFFLSRAEWDTLVKETQAQIQLWSVYRDTQLHASIPVSDIQQHIPSDTGNGSWQKCRIPFKTFIPINRNIHGTKHY